MPNKKLWDLPRADAITGNEVVPLTTAASNTAADLNFISAWFNAKPTAYNFGALSVEPTVSPFDGGPIPLGAQYYNSTTNELRSYGAFGWFTPNIDALLLAAPTGATLVGTPAGTVQAAIDARPTSAALAASGGAALVGLNDHTLKQILESGASATDKRPAFVETFVPIHSVPYVPANIATYQTGTDPSGGGGQLSQFTLTVTAGAAGALSATVAESAIVSGIGATNWPCVVEYTDGTHGFNIVKDGSGSTVNLRFALEKAAAFISPTWDAALGQHMTKRGYRALADLVYDQRASFCTATRFVGAGCFTNQPPAYQQLFAANAALAAYGVVNVNNVVSGMVADTLTGNLVDTAGCLSRTAVAPMGVTTGVHATGHGVTGTIAVNRQRGFIETHVFTSAIGSSTPTQRGSATLNAYGIVGGAEYLIYTKAFADFTERVLIPFDGYDSVRLEAVAVSNYAFFIRLMDTKAWLSESGDSPLVGKNSKVVTMGDSWFAYYGTTDGAVSTGLGAFSQRLQDRMRADSGTGIVKNKSRGGMTTEWALAWFDTYVLPEKPDQVIFNFFTNDANTTSATATFVDPTGATVNNRITDSNHWRANIAKLAAKCERAGIQPIFILPSGTASTSQAQNQMTWRRSLRQGVHADTSPKSLSSELADTASFINTFGKYAGKPAVVGASIFYAQGSLPADAWRNTQNERISNLEVQTYDFTAFDKNVAKIGTDSNSDGLSDGVTTQGYGVQTGTTYTPSIASGVQLQTANYTDPAGTGSQRLKFDFTCVSGRNYFLIAEFKNSSPAVIPEVIGFFYGAAVSIANSALGGSLPTDGAGAITKAWRFNAVTSTAAYFSAVVNGSRASLPVSYVTGIKRVHLVDLTSLQSTLGIDVAGMSDTELFALLNAALQVVPPTSLRVTDSVTGLLKRIIVSSGVISVV